jgi:molybdopterin synthase catalytic subunit
MSIHVHMVDGPLPTGTPPLRVEGAGAIVSFEGIVRPTEMQGPIVGLRYETYDPMAERELRRLSDEATRRFGLISLVVWHSRGLVPVGACPFRVIVASARRKEALAAMDWFVDAVKRDAPIWKHAVPVGQSGVPEGGEESCTR